jgi:hypothetical protein
VDTANSYIENLEMLSWRFFPLAKPRGGKQIDNFGAFFLGEKFTFGAFYFFLVDICHLAHIFPLVKPREVKLIL